MYNNIARPNKSGEKNRAAEKDTRPVLIFDTDMDTDCDDAAALVLVMQAHLAGLATLAGVVTDSLSPHAAPCCEAFLLYYGLSCPVGAVHTEDYPQKGPDAQRFAAYRKHRLLCRDRCYNSVLAAPIGRTDRDYPRAGLFYRRLLADADDASLTVLCIGTLTAVAEALASLPDEISPYDGITLFRRKVQRVVCMGDPGRTGDFNWSMDATAAQYFFAHCPVPIHISPEGRDILTGASFSLRLPPLHPLRRAYEIWLGGPGLGRSSWDPIAALYALRPDAPVFSVRPFGNCRYDPATAAAFSMPSDTPRDSLVRLPEHSGQTVRMLESCMLNACFP